MGIFIYWVLYTPTVRANGQLQYVRMPDESDHGYHPDDAKAHFNGCKHYFDAPPGSLVRLEVYDDGFSDDFDSSDDEGDDDINRIAQCGLKWRAYRSFKTEDHYKCVEESQEVFTTYEECVADFKQSCKCKEKYPDKTFECFPELYKYDFTVTE